MADGPLRHRYLADGVPVTIVNALGGIRRLPAYETRMGRLGDSVARDGVDLVLANTLPAFWAVDMARRAGVQLSSCPECWTFRLTLMPQVCTLVDW